MYTDHFHFQGGPQLCVGPTYTFIVRVRLLGRDRVLKAGAAVLTYADVCCGPACS